MEEGKKLSRRLYIISIFLFSILVYSIINSIYKDIVWEKIKGENFKNTNEINTDFSIPVNLSNVNNSDTLIEYANVNDNTGGQISTNKLIGDEEYYNKIKNNPNNLKKYTIHKYDIFDNKINQENINHKFNNFYLYNGQAEAMINPKELRHKIILYVDKYYKSFFYLIILFQSIIFFKKLKDEFHFNFYLKRNLKIIGYVVLLMPIFEYPIYYFKSTIFKEITTTLSIVSDKSNFNYELYTANLKSIPIDLVTILIGFTIIVLSKLFEYGNTIQKQNELTI
jgi:hypothetical protein